MIWWFSKIILIRFGYIGLGEPYRWVREQGMKDRFLKKKGTE